MQTDQSKDAGQDLQQEAQIDYTSLLSFLQRVEDAVIKELNKNWKSRAFDGFEVSWTDQNETVSWQNSDPCPFPSRAVAVTLSLVLFLAAVIVLARLSSLDITRWVFPQLSLLAGACARLVKVFVLLVTV